VTEETRDRGVYRTRLDKLEQPAEKKPRWPGFDVLGQTASEGSAIPDCCGGDSTTASDPEVRAKLTQEDANAVDRPQAPGHA